MFPCSGSQENITFEKLVAYLEQSCRHLESLADPLIYELRETDEVNEDFVLGKALGCNSSCLRIIFISYCLYPDDHSTKSLHPFLIFPNILRLPKFHHRFVDDNLINFYHIFGDEKRFGKFLKIDNARLLIIADGNQTICYIHLH